MPTPVLRPEAANISLHDLSSREWRKCLAGYAKPNTLRASFQLLNTVLPFLGSMAVLLYGSGHADWFAWLMAIPATLFAVRLFVIQHDCGHVSFLRSRRCNETVGRVISLMTLVPFGSWRRAHAVHHATTGNLDQRGTGDITTLTVAEYLSQSTWRRMLYRAYRNPFVLLGLGPLYLLLVQNRIPARTLRRDWRNWVSVIGTDVGAAVIVMGASLIITPLVFLAAWFSVLYLASVIGIWLFCVQHQFGDTYWERSGRWAFQTAAIEGSSFYDLPRILHWFTGYIGLHHVHHLASRIPNYHLRACLEQNRELQRTKRLTLWGSIKSARLALWDEEGRRLVSFRQIVGMPTRSSSSTPLTPCV